MLKIKALNKDCVSDEDAPTIRKEAQEEIALDLYNKALRLQASNQFSEAETILQQLLNENIPQLESQGGLPKTMSTLKYSCHVNIGNICRSKKNYENAFESYMQASELDKTDVTLWYKIGMIALKLERFGEAIYAYSQGLECNESHWPCLDNLIILLYASGDAIGCLCYITKALLLNSDYTRGLVLRKRIYEANPAARDYYKLYNPEYAQEPDLNVPIDKEDEIKYMKDVDRISDCINKLEKALETKPLPLISLPSPLEEYTWCSVAKTVINLHQYLSNNKMSHFCKIDLSKCMSENGISNSMECDLIAPEDVPMIVETEVMETECNGTPPTITEAEVKSVEDVSRRMSVTSENNGDVNDSGVENVTGSQAEDNDEMDQDTEDQEENSDQKSSDKKQGIKRRSRNLLLDLQIWGWHSKRKSSKRNKTEKNMDIQSALKYMIPAHLLPKGLRLENFESVEDLTGSPEIKNTSTNQQMMFESFPSKIPSVVGDLNTEYFGSQKEKDDVLKFWTKEFQCCDAVSLVEELVHILSLFWNMKWPKKLINLYIELYHMYREHFEHPPLFDSATSFNDIKTDALATLLYGELTLYKNAAGETNDMIHPTSLTILQLLSAREAEWAADHISFFVRVHWLRSHYFRKSLENILAIRSLELVQEVVISEEERIGEKFTIEFPNCENYPALNLHALKKFLKHLQMIDSLSRLEELYNSRCYQEVTEVLQSTFLCVGTPPTYGKMGRPAQLGMLMDSLWFVNKSECFVWTGKCLSEAVTHFLKPQKDQDKWELVLGKCLVVMLEIIKHETIIIFDILTPEQRFMLIENLCRIVCRQLTLENTQNIPLDAVTPWILLHHVLLREEHREQASKTVSHVRKKRKTDPVTESSDEDAQEKEVPPSLAVLFSAHEFLGPKSWCLTSSGELLHFMIDNTLDKLDTPIFDALRDKIDIHLEQAFFCLYQHPSKKNKISRHLAVHNVNPLPLSWERAQQLYEFFCPDHLPEFDSFKTLSITSDVEQLLQRIIVLVPSEIDPNVSLSKISDFVNGTCTDLPVPIEFPNKVRNIYYLLGDFFLKQNEVPRSVKYFLLDLCINPDRSDTWADLALGYASQLESKLTHCERFKSENEFLEKAKSARICFQQALNLMEDPITLWIEFGSFEYMVHSYCSRVLKYESEMLSMEKFEILENEKESYLEGSGNSFAKALSLCKPEQSDSDERWLHHYMLGKVAEKRRQEPVEYLQHYLTAAALLQESNASYPAKINYHSPQHLSVEALEIHYRIHASILKFLELHEGKSIASSIGKVFKTCLDTSNLYKTTTALVEKKSEKTPSQATSKDDYAEILDCMKDLLDKVELEENKSVADDMPKVKGDDLESNVLTTTVNTTNVQDIMDALMQQTMAKEEMVIDSDSDYTSTDAEMKVDDIKLNEDIELCLTKSIINLPYKRENLPVDKSEEETPNIRKSVDETTTSSSSDTSSSDSDDSDDSSSTSSSQSSSSVNTTNMSNADVNILINRCIVGLEECVTRLPQNYKALYRLIHLYLNYVSKKNVIKCKQLLLGEYKCTSGSTVQGLFAEHKQNNFFNGVWRIPSSEIDRAGSLAAHMNRCVTILLQVLRESNDFKILLDVCLQLKRTPDSDKVYIRNTEREQLSEQALSLCIHSLRSQLKSVTDTTATQKLLIDIFRAYQRIQKYVPAKESVFSSLLVESYKKFMKDKVPENVNVQDLAIKYCQQHKVAEKVKVNTPKQVVPSSTTVTAPTVGSAPVLPTPSTIPRPNSSNPLRRSTLGRPRGRPPGPKQAGTSRSPKGRNSSYNSNQFSWQNMMYDQTALNCMIKYQEELLRQYKALTEMNLMSYGNQQDLFSGQLTQTINNQSSLLNTNQLIQAFSQMANSNQNPLSVNQTNQSLGNLNPNLLKLFMEQFNQPRTAASSSSLSSTTITPVTKTALSLTKSTIPVTKPAVSLAKSAVPLTKPTVSVTKPVIPVTKAALSLTKASISSTKPAAHTTKPATFSHSSSPVDTFKKSTINANSPKFTNGVPSSSPIELLKKPATITSVPKISSSISILKSSPSSINTTYTSANFGKGAIPSSIKYSSSHSTNPKPPETITINLPSSEATNLSDIKKFSNKVSSVSTPKSSMFGSNISITPVMQTVCSVKPSNTLPVSTNTGKTLQEKLADKQKQHLLDAKNNEKCKGQSTSNFSAPSSSISHAPRPSFSLDSGISISQVSIPHSNTQSRGDHHSNIINQKSTNLLSKPSNFPSPKPLSVSVIRNTSEAKEKQKVKQEDDDVIIIE